MFIQICIPPKSLWHNIAEDVKLPKIDNLPKKDYFEESQMIYLLEKVKNAEDKRSIRDYAMIALMTSCGLRDIEVVNSNWEDIDSMRAKWKPHVLGKGRAEKGDFVIIPHQVKIIAENNTVTQTVANAIFH